MVLPRRLAGARPRLHGFLSAANEPDGDMFYDWIPADAPTWLALEKLAAR